MPRAVPPASTRSVRLRYAYTALSDPPCTVRSACSSPRSVSEVYVHIASGNFLLLSLTAGKLPADRELSSLRRRHLGVMHRAEARCLLSVTPRLYCMGTSRLGSINLWNSV